MSVELACPACGAVNAFTDEQSGRMGKCGQCHTPLYVPRREEMPASRAGAGPRVGWGGGLFTLLLAAAAVFVLLILGGVAALGYFLFYPKGNTTTNPSTAKETKDAFLSAPVVKLETSRSATQDGALEQATDESLFKFKAPASGTVLVYFDAAEGSKLDGHLFALDSQRKEITQNDSDADRRLSMIQFPVSGDQDYFVKVAAFDGTSGKYKLRFAHVTSVGSDAANALEVRLTKAGTGSQAWRLDRPGEVNLFRVVAPYSGMMNVTLTYPSGSILEAKMTVQDSRQLALFTAAVPPRFYFEKGNIYYVRVEPYEPPLDNRSRSGAYALTFKLDKSTGNEPGKSFASATKVYFNGSAASVTGQIINPSDAVYFSFTAPKTGTMQIDILPDGLLDPEFQVYDGSQNLYGGTTNAQKFYDPLVTGGLTYFVKVVARPVPGSGLQRTGSFKLNFNMLAQDVKEEKKGKDAGNAKQVALDAKNPGQLRFQNGVAALDSQLTATDPFDKTRTTSYSKVFTVALAAGNKYQIDMQSAQLDCYLRLENSTKTQLATDNGSGGNLNARILFDCLASGTYRIIATTFDGGVTGSFTLKVQTK